ncbi:MAG: hypothetical protein QGF59_20900 [Pirellulaceae bacterium]|nr:hypothetical protein [Pirellulaceae bacterium]
MSRPGEIRTPDQGIMSQRVSAKNAEECAHSENRAAAGAAVGSGNDPLDVELHVIVDRWPELPDAIKTGIMAMVLAD